MNTNYSNYGETNQQVLTNVENYGPFRELIETGSLIIYTNNINKETWKSYYDGCLNVMKDGIETDFVKKTKVNIIFPDNLQCRLTLLDLYFNIIMWYMFICIDKPIESKHLFFDKAITGGTIKKYIDENFIIPNREYVNLKLMNNIIDDTLHRYMDIDMFSMFIGSTVNLEDFVELSIKSPRFNELMHADLSDVSIENVKDAGMELTYEAIDIIDKSKEIMGYEHCLADSFRSKEGTNIKQFKEFAINIGSKPDGQGGAFPVGVNNSYLNGGLNQIMYEFIDSSASRYAQIIAKNNVGESGNFARILGLNSIDTVLRSDAEYACNTKNFLKINITSNELLKRYADRWYRMSPNGVEKLCTGRETWLIGHTVYFRSPEFCASAASGNGVCFRCYGMLAYINRNVNIGKMAAELFSSKTTQRRLSAKHLLETKIKQFTWNENFYKFINVASNLLTLNTDYANEIGWNLLIHTDDIILENDEDYEKPEYDEDNISDSNFEDDADNDEQDLDIDDTNYNEYVTKFYVTSPEGERFEIRGESEEYRMYISNALNTLIRRSIGKLDDGFIVLDFDTIQDTALFFIKLENNDLGKSLDNISHLMDKQSVTSTYDAHSLTQAILEETIEGDINVQAVHFEIMLMNQIRSIYSNIKKPQWEYENEPYKILTLKKSLRDNPSVAVSLMYQHLSHTLYYPLTFQKTAPSFMDVFFMKQPQNFMEDNSSLIDTEVKPKKRNPIMRIHKRD